jgi:NADH dehydrogenase/NADH:ubiquinone oxidoreductase subunit G
MSHHKPDPNKNINLIIDGLPVCVPEGTTILEAAKKVNVKIPTLCDYPDLRRRAVCRLCVVECDGRAKLVAACANDVWEGVSIVTNNARLMSIRKAIIELILANHPQECLSCVGNMKCELQSLTEAFGIRESPFAAETSARHPRDAAGDMLVRDMDKCVKCGRCVEVCQEIQTVRALNTSHRSIEYEISLPFGQTLIDSPCIFCGQCAVVCPVGAIFQYEQSTDVWKALNNSKQQVAAELAPSMSKDLSEELKFLPGTITQGKIVTALKFIGFNKVYDAGFFKDLCTREEFSELLHRIKNAGKLPMISGCSAGWNKFAEDNFPDLSNHLAVTRSSGQIFGDLAKHDISQAQNINKSFVTTVSFMPCITKKRETRFLGDDFSRNVTFSLSPREFANMIRLVGIKFDNIPETPFDALNHIPDSMESDAPLLDQSQKGITEAILESEGHKVKALIVSGLANARNVLESIRNGECDAEFVKILICPKGCKAYQ